MAVRVRAVLLLLLALLASQAALARKFGVTTDDEGKPALEEGDVQAKDPTHITDKATTALASSPPKPVLEVPTAPPGVSGPAGNGKKSKAGLTTPPEYSFIQPVKKGEAAPPSKQPPAPSKEPGPPKEPASQKDPQFHLPTKKDTTVPSTVGKPAPSKEDPPTSKEETSPPPKKDPNPPPKEDTAPPPKNGGNPPAKKETNPPPKTDPAAVPKNDGNPPPKNEVNPPPKKETNPPPKKETNPPPKKDTNPPPKKDTNPPPKKDTNPPPKKETNPPPKKETNPPPKKEANPPPKKETNPPPKKEVNPPPKKDNTPAPKNHSGTGPEKPVPPPKQESPSSPKKDPKPTPATTKEGGKSEAPPQKPPQPSSDVELIPPQKIRPTWTPPHEYIIPKGFECINFGPVRQPGMIQYTASDIIGGHVRSFSVPHDRFPKLPTAFLSHVYGKHFKYVLRTGHKNPKRAFDLLLGFAEVYPDLCGKNAKKREFSLHAGRHWRKVNAKASVGCGKQLKIPLKAVASTDGTIVFTFKAYAENAMVSLICYSPTYIPHKTTTANSKPPSNKPVTQVISKSNEKKNTQKPTTKSNNKVGTEKQSPSSPVPLPSVALPKPSVSSPAKDTNTDPAPKEDTAGKTTTPVTQVEAPAWKDTSSAPTPKTDNSGNTTTPVTKVEALAPKDKTTAPDLKTMQAGNKTSPVTKVETPASGTSGGEALDTIDGLSKQKGVKCVNFGKGIVKGFAAATWTAFSGNVSYYTSSTAIKDTSLSESFQSHAFGEAFSYALAVPKMGTYNLALGFAETFDLVCKSPTPNFRLFTVAAGSQTKIMAIYGTAGCNTAYTEILHGVKSETGSVITIGFEASENNAMISNLCFWESNTKLAVPKGDGKPVTKSVAIPSVQVPAASVGIATKEDSVPSAVSGKNSTAEKPSPKASTSASASAAASSMPSASAAASASVSASSSASAAASVSASASPSVSASAKPKKQNPPVTKEDPKPSSSPVPEDKPPAAGKPAKESPLPKFTRGVIEDTQGGHGSGKSVPAIVSTKNSTKATTKQDSETSDKNPTEGKAPKGSPLPKVTTGVIEDTRGGHGSGPNILIENNNTMLDWGDGGKSNGTDLSKGKFEAVNGTKTDVVITIFSSKAPIPSTNASAPDVGVKAPVLGSSAPAAPVLEESPNGGVAIPVIVDPPAIATREPPQKTQDILVLFPSASLTPGTAAPSPSAPPTSDPTTTGPSPSILVLLPPPGVQPPQAAPTAAKSPDITVGSPNASTSAVVSPTPVESSDVSITIGNVTAPAPSVLPSVPVDPSPTSDGDISVPEIPTGNDTGISLPSIISASPSASSGNDTNGDISVPSIISASPSASSGNDTNGDINVPSLISASPSPGGISVPSIVLPSPGVGAGNQTGPGDIGNGGADASSSAVPTPSIGTDNGSVAAIPIIVAPTQNPDSTSAANIVLLPLPSGVTPPSPSPTPMEIVTAIPLVPQNSTGTAASSGNDNDFVITIPGGDTSQVLMGAPINSSGPSPKPEPLSFSDQKQVAASPSASASTSPSASMSMSASPAASASSSVSPSISVSPSVSMSPKPPTSKTGGNEIITIDNSPVPSGSVTPPLPSVDPAIIEVPESPRPQPSVQAKTAPPTAAPTAVIVGPYAEAVGLRKYSNSAFPVLMGIIGSLLIIMLITCLYFAIFAGRRNRSNSNASQYTYQGDDYDRPQGNNYGATLGAQGGYPVATGYEDESDLGARIQSGSAASDPAYPNGSNAGSAPSGQGTYDQEADEFGPYGAAPMGGAPNLNDHELSADGSGNAYSMGGGAGEQTMEDVPLGYGPVDPNGQQDNSFEFAQDGAPGATHALPQMQQHSFEEDHSIARPDRIGSESSGNEERQTMSTEHEDDDDMYSDYGNERPAGMNGKSNSQHVRDQLANIHRQIASQLAANSSRSSSGAEDFTPRDSQGSGADKSGVPASQQSSSVARQSNSTDDDTNELCYKDTCDDDNGEGANKEQDPENVEGASDPWPFWYNAPRAGPHASTYHQAGGNRGAAMGGPALLASVRDKLIATQAPETIDERDEETNSDTSWIRRKRSVGTAEPPVPPPAEDAAPASGPIFGAPTLAQRWPAGTNSESENSSVTGSAKYSDGLSSTSSGKPPAGGGEFPVALRPATGGAPTLQDISGRAAYNQTMLQAGTGKRVAFWEGAQAPQVELGAVGSVPFQPADPERNRFSQRFGQPRASAEPVVPVDVEELRKRREPNVKEAAKRLSQATHRSSSSMQSSVIR